MKSCTLLKFNPYERKWEEKVWRYTSWPHLFRKMSFHINMRKETYIPKDGRLRNMWDEWVMQPMTDKDRERLKRAENMSFCEFTMAFIWRFETDEAIKRLDTIMYHAYLKEEARADMI